MTALIADRLRQRARRRGGEPLITYYDLGSGERTELSATSFLNWVDKTSNLLVDEYLINPGDLIDLAVANRAPGHWVTLVFELAAWQIGALVRVGSFRVASPLLVAGPAWEATDLERADAVLACSLHPLGLGFAMALPPGVDDFALEVRSQPDQYAPTPRSGLEAAWTDDALRLTQADLVAVGHPSHPARRLVRVSDPWTAVRDGLVAPLLTDGSAVLVVGDDEDQIARISSTERVEPVEASR